MRRNYLLANKLNDYFVTITIAGSVNHSFEPANGWFGCRQHPIRLIVPFGPTRLATIWADCSRLEALELAENIIHVAKSSTNCSCKWKRKKQNIQYQKIPSVSHSHRHSRDVWLNFMLQSFRIEIDPITLNSLDIYCSFINYITR